MQRPTLLHSKQVFIDNDQFIEALRQIEDDLKAAGYKNDQIHELVNKVNAQQYGIAFCGHFSAGKSTLINKLLGEHVLPASPIPTSANVVKMISGSPKVIVEFSDSTHKTFTGSYHHKTIQEYCLDGTNVKRLTIFSERYELPEGLFILDTPGIDSTDDAHKVVAESTLHIADTVVYMMDYNHVQSDINYAFLKEMSSRHKKLIIVVNQIDKHQNTEMSLDEFKSRTVTSIENEKITYDAIFFTSAVERDDLNNELSELQNFLETIIHDRTQLLSVSVWNEANLVITAYEQWLKSSNKSRILEFEEILSPYHLSDVSLLQAELERIKKATMSRSDVIEEFEEMFLQQFSTLLNNANLMPYHTRNLARDFLEAEQVGYKVRGWFSAKKTKAERERRRNALFHELKENAVTYIDIHFKDMFFKLLKQYQIRNENLIREVHRFSGDLQPDIILRSQKKGALFSHEYVLNFSKSLMDEVKRHYRKKVNELLGMAVVAVGDTIAGQTKELVRKRNDIEKKLTACVELQEINTKIEAEVSELVNKLESIVQYHSPKSKGTNVKDLKAFRFKGRRNIKEKKQSVNLSELSSDLSEVGSYSLEREKDRRLSAATHIENVGEILKEVPSLQRLSENFIKQSQRLKEKSFTIALFGAFSAGKSSLANALVGANVLPVSPHPTTATINQILPPTSDYPHGTIQAFYKEESEVKAEINDVLQVTNHHILSLEELKHLLEERRRVLEDKEPSNNQAKKDEEEDEVEEDELIDPFELLRPNQLQFLTSVADGYENVKELLGRSLFVTYEDYKNLVATESLAAFIDRIDVYYNSEIARQGITLVDTPGANSIHKRHTELAFNFIKHADAIVFLTYYNHAFSKSDREFLIQLGRVKNCFDTDKMFFIINAADLAESEDELRLVISHVEKNLQHCGIRYPQIYPISSQLALLSKLKNTRLLTEEEKITCRQYLPEELDSKGLEYSGILTFERSFYTYILCELTNVTIRGSGTSIVQLNQTLQKWYADANKEEKEKRRQIEELRQFVAIKKKEISAASFTIEEQLVRQEIHELIYYVKQRVFYRYFDEFKESIHPTNFVDDDHFQQQLRFGVHHVLQFIAFDLLQELQATSLRIEKFIIKCLQEIENHMIKAIIGKEAFSFLQFSIGPMEELNFQLFSRVQVTDFDDMLKEYTNSNMFFIEKGNLQLRDKLEERLRSPVDQYLKSYQNYYEEIASEWFLHELEKLKAHYMTELDHYENELSYVLSDEGLTFVLKKMINQLDNERKQLSTYVK